MLLKIPVLVLVIEPPAPLPQTIIAAPNAPPLLEILPLLVMLESGVVLIPNKLLPVTEIVPEFAMTPPLPEMPYPSITVIVPSLVKGEDPVKVVFNVVPAGLSAAKLLKLTTKAADIKKYWDKLKNFLI